MANKQLINDSYVKRVGSNCSLVIGQKDWHIAYDANTLEEDDDLKYKVSDYKIEQFLFDLKKNLALYLNTKQDGTDKNDLEALREMIIRYKGEKPGVYLTDTFYMLSTEEEYNEVVNTITYAKQLVCEVRGNE